MFSFFRRQKDRLAAADEDNAVAAEAATKASWNSVLDSAESTHEIKQGRQKQGEIMDVLDEALEALKEKAR